MAILSLTPWNLLGTYAHSGGSEASEPAMPKLRFTARGIEAIKPPEERTPKEKRDELKARGIKPENGQIDYWDTSVPGFILRVSYGGRKVWGLIYRHEGRKRRLTLGTYPPLSLADARAKANDALREVAQGKDPAADKLEQRRAETFGEMVAEYIEKHAKAKKRSWRKDERAFERDLLPRWRNRKATSITRNEVVRSLDDIIERGAGIQANRTLEILRKCFNWAISRDIVSHNPCVGVERPAEEHARERVLTGNEIRAVWKALEKQPLMVAVAFRLRLLTVQRGQEVEKMRWEDIDRASGWWTIPGQWTKNGLAHRVPLSRPAMEVLDELDADGERTAWVFKSDKRDGPVTTLWRATPSIRKASGVDFVGHDLRRTAASRMTGMGISRLTVSKLLNYAEAGITRIYDRHSDDPEKKQALDAWGARVEQIVAGKPSDLADEKVVPMRRG